MLMAHVLPDELEARSLALERRLRTDGRLTSGDWDRLQSWGPSA